MKAERLGQAVQLLVATILCAMLAACGGSGSGNQTEPQPTRHASSLTILAGNNQSATVGTPLPAPLQVKVADEDGQPFPGATVTWSVTAGGGNVQLSSSTTQADGTSSVRWTLGTQAGLNSVTAAVAGVSPAAFSATGLAGPFARINISVPGPPTENGDMTQLNASGTDAFGNPVPLPPVTWASADPAV